MNEMLPSPIAYPVIVVGVDIPRHAEVGDLDDQATAHQAVPCGQVTMNEPLGGQVAHPTGDLHADVN